MKNTECKHLIRIFLLGALLSLAWGGLTYLLHLDRIFPDRVQERLFSVSLPAQFALYGFLSPVLEECLFRGFLFFLLRRFLSERVSAILTAAIFALWHWNMIQILYAFPMGLLFQYLLRRDGSLKSPICCHIGANLAAISAQALLF